MNDPSNGRDGDAGSSGPKPARPMPVGRQEGPKPSRPRSARHSSTSKLAGDDSASDRAKPTPVRDMAAVDAPPPPVEPDVEEARVVVNDDEWTVRVVGRAGGSAPSATPLLLLGFWPVGGAEEGRTREALVVGRSLAQMTPAALVTAFEASSPAPSPREVGSASKGSVRRGRDGRSRGRGS